MDLPLLLLLLLLSHFSRVRLCATPQTAAHQAPPSLEFSRQEHWSGLPFPSPMHESESEVAQLVIRVRLLAIPWTAAYQAPPSMGFSRQEYWSGFPSPSPGPATRECNFSCFIQLYLTKITCVRLKTTPSIQQNKLVSCNLQSRGAITPI